MGRFGARLVEDEEETQAQNKVVFGLLLLLMIYPAAFYFLWAFFWYTPVGALIAGSFVFLFAMYHNRLINRTSLSFPHGPIPAVPGSDAFLPSPMPACLVYFTTSHSLL